MTGAATGLPDGYPELLAELKRTVAAARWQAQRVVNTELLRLYWQLGAAVLERQRSEGWGTRVIDRLATDLRAGLPRHAGPVVQQPVLHAVVRRGLAAQRDRPTGCWTTALGPRHGAARPARRPSRAGLVRGQSRRARLVPQRPDPPDPEPAAHPGRRRPLQLPRSAAPRRLRTGPTADPRPPPPSASCCAPAATTTSSATPSPAPPPRSPSPTTPTTRSRPPPARRCRPANSSKTRPLRRSACSRHPHRRHAPQGRCHAQRRGDHERRRRPRSAGDVRVGATGATPGALGSRRLIVARQPPGQSHHRQRGSVRLSVTPSQRTPLRVHHPAEIADARGRSAGRSARRKPPLDQLSQTRTRQGS